MTTTTTIDREQTEHWVNQLALLDPRAGDVEASENSFFNEALHMLIRLADCFTCHDVDELRRHLQELSAEDIPHELFCDKTNVALEFLLTRLIPQRFLSYGDAGYANSVRERKFDAAIGFGNDRSVTEDGYSVLDVGPSSDAGLSTTIDCLPGAPAIAEVFAVPRGYIVVSFDDKQFTPPFDAEQLDDDGEPLPFRWFDRDEQPKPIKKATMANA